MKDLIIFAGGGTGGHLYPGLAIAERWSELHGPDACLFVGTSREIELQILKSYPFEHLSLSFISPRKGWRHPIRFLKNLRASNREIHAQLKRRAPRLVIGLGSYAAYPTITAALQLGIPVLLLEQNAVPGRVTRLFARASSGVLISFPQAAAKLPKEARCIHTGNPLRREIVELKASMKYETPTLLITGGSQGATQLNDTFLRVVQEVPELISNFQIRHQTGPNSNLDQVNAVYKSAGITAEVRPYFESAVELYQNISLAITRAGGTTLAELAYLEVPSVIVPIPNSAGNHQLANAIAQAVRPGHEYVNQLDHDYDLKFRNSLQKIVAYMDSPECNQDILPQIDVISRILDVIDKLCTDTK